MQLLFLFFALISIIQSSNPCDCAGKTDVIFVLDMNYEIDDDDFGKVQTFLNETFQNLCIKDDGIKVGITQFTSTNSSGNVKLDLQLTGNQQTALNMVENMNRFGNGSAPLHEGLEIAYDQLNKNGRSDAYKFVVVLSSAITDSCKGKNIESFNEGSCEQDYETCFQSSQNNTCYWEIMENHKYTDTCCSNDYYWKRKLEDDLHSFIFSIAVGNMVDPYYLKSRVSTVHEYFHHATSYSALPKTLPNYLCIDAVSTDPEIISPEDMDFTIYGTGFIESIQTYARFYLGSIYVQYEAEFINSNSLGIELQMDFVQKHHFSRAGLHEFAVSLGGNIFSDKLQIYYNGTEYNGSVSSHSVKLSFIFVILAILFF